jgi:hypothetical protein
MTKIEIGKNYKFFLDRFETNVKNYQNDIFSSVLEIENGIVNCIRKKNNIDISKKITFSGVVYEIKKSYGVDDNFPVVGKVRPTERYKFIVDEEAYKSLPTDTIATSQYDYSFHVGEGIVTSWIMAIGRDQSEVKHKLDAALKKVKVQYVGSEIELKYTQKRVVGR